MSQRRYRFMWPLLLWLLLTVLSAASTASAGPDPRAPAPKSINPENFNPGHYLSVGAGNVSPAAAFREIADNPYFIGGKRIYTWRSLEPSFGEYDFSRIEKDLEYLQSIGKRLWIQVGYTQFNASAIPNVPVYMWVNPAFGCGPEFYGIYRRQAQKGGWIPCYWNDNLGDRFVSLISALGARFNDEPYFEGISIGETAIDHRAARSQGGYSVKAVKDAFKKKILAARQAFPDKMSCR